MLWVIVAVSVGAFWLVCVPLFERVASPGAVRVLQRLTMPTFRPLVGFVPGFGLVETTGRRTGRTYRTPVGGRIEHGTFWFVAGVGRNARYVRNIEESPRIRVKALGR